MTKRLLPTPASAEGGRRGGSQEGLRAAISLAFAAEGREGEKDVVVLGLIGPYGGISAICKEGRCHQEA